MPKDAVVVIGAGIIGLTSAIRIQETSGDGTKIMVVASEFPSDRSIDYATPWAGAHFRPIPGDSPQLVKEAAWARHTYEVLHQEWTKEPAAGIQFLTGVEYLEKPTDAYTELTGGYANTKDFKVLDPSLLPPDVEFGAQYTTWCLNPPVYCSHLLRKFTLRGGKVLRRRLSHIEEAFALMAKVKTVVNCSGVGFGDPSVYAIRGQTCLVTNQADKTVTYQHADGTWTFVIPGPLRGGTIIGGTKEPHNYSSEAIFETRERLLQRAAALFPELADSKHAFHVLQDIVGRRPARHGGLRLDVEQLGKGRRIIHAYGAGGRGIEISWAVAEDVARLYLKPAVLFSQL